jgi:hypothetical protein
VVRKFDRRGRRPDADDRDPQYSPARPAPVRVAPLDDQPRHGDRTGESIEPVRQGRGGEGDQDEADDSDQSSGYAGPQGCEDGQRGEHEADTEEERPAAAEKVQDPVHGRGPFVAHQFAGLGSGSISTVPAGTLSGVTCGFRL